MTFDANGHWISSDQADETWYRDYGSYLAGVMRIQSTLLSQIGWGNPTRSIVFYQGKVATGNSKYIEATDDADGALASGETSFTVDEATYNRIQVGMELRDIATANVTRPSAYNGYELLAVSNKTIEAGPAYTVHVTRDYGHDTSGETLPSHLAGATYEVMNFPQYERSVSGPNNWFGSDQWTAYTQIFRKDLAVSGSYLEMEFEGTMTQDLAFQIQQMTEELQPEFLSSALYGKHNPTKPEGGRDDSGNEHRRTTDGVFHTVASRSGIVLDHTTWAPDVLDDAAIELEKTGAMGTNRVLTAYCNPTRIDATYAWDRDMLRRDADSNTRGGFVRTYRTPRGYTFNFYSDPYIHESDLLIGPPNIGQYVKWRPLGSRKFFAFRYQNPGEDGQCAAILSEMGLECTEVEKRFAVCMTLG